MDIVLLTWKITTDPRTVTATCGRGNNLLKKKINSLIQRHNQPLEIEYRIPNGKWLGTWILKGGTREILEDAQAWIQHRERFYLNQFRQGKRDMILSYPEVPDLRLTSVN